MGQDRSYDLAQYHWYNAYAFLNNRVETDFGVAGIQTYLNPLIDVPYYFLNQHLSPRFVGWFFGFLHGLVFILSFLIIQNIYKNYKSTKKQNIYFLIALTGCLTPNFLAELGNSMGDNLTALLVLTSLAILLRFWSVKNIQTTKGFIAFCFASCLLGLSVGLKLTNAPFAIAYLFSLLLFHPSNSHNKIMYLVWAIVGMTMGVIITGGFWYFKMWVLFKNPVFPFFNSLFNTQIHLKTAVFGGSSYPTNFIEWVTWPFISFIDYHRAGRGLVHQIIWPIFFGLIYYLTITRLFFIKQYNQLNLLLNQEKFIISFIIIGYYLSGLVFENNRYLIAIEILVPFGIYILIRKLHSNEENTKKTIKGILLISIFITLLGGFGTWGHTSWTKPVFKADIPKVKDYEKATFIFADVNSPNAWLASLMPRGARYFRLNQFENSEDKLISMLEKDKNIFAVFSGNVNWRESNVKKWSNVMSKIGFLSSYENCQRLNEFITKIKFRGKVEINNNSCEIILKEKDKIDIKEADLESISKTSIIIKENKMHLLQNECHIFPGSIGRQEWSFIICRVEK